MSAVTIGSRRELFVDHFLLEDLDGTFLKLHEPVPMETSIQIDHPWEYEASCGYNVVCADGKYLMYYRGKDHLNPDGDVRTCIAVSDDGISWTKPVLQPEEGTNFVTASDGVFVNNIFYDACPHTPKDQRIKGFISVALSGEAHTPTYDPAGGKRLVFYTSADGFTFQPMDPQPNLVSHLNNSFDGGCTMSWSEEEQAYVFYYRTSYMQAKNVRRAVARTTSRDFYHWTEPVIMSHSNTPEQFYVNNTYPYYRAPHIYLGLAARFMEGKKVLTEQQAEESGTIRLKYWNPVSGDVDMITYNDCSDAVLLSTRAGSTVYDRTFMEAYVYPGIGYGNWASRCNYPFTGFHQLNDTTLSFYVWRRYFQKAWHIQRLSLRIDGFSSLTAPWKGGTALTKPFIFSGSHLELNYRTSAAGYILVELTDADGNILPGFEAESCEEIVGDEISRTVKWCSGFNLGSYAGKEVRLRFQMKDADLFSYRFY